MIIMAVLKHITIKNGNYTDALDYLLFQHNEETKKPILDEKGRRILREEYYIDGINCEAMLFDQECEKLNQQYHKNQSYDEIKSHHYIISFDPKDKDERGLTGEKAQALGVEYAQKYFPGHQALIVTHTDGYNNSGNIHVHIVINSLRKYNVEPQDFMERPCDSKAGYKHHLTKDYLRYLKKSLMEMCLRENLNQIDLLSPAKDRVTEKEYWASRRGQKALDKRNDYIRDAGLKPRMTVFQTQKQYLRDAILNTAVVANSFEEFRRLLYEKYHITLNEKRGRLSYLHPERNKNISDRALGSGYTKDSILEMINEKRSVSESVKGKEVLYSATQFPEDISTILFASSNLRLVIDLQNCVKAQQSKAYERKVKISNLQEMAKTILYIQENNYDTKEDLQASYEEVSQKLSAARASLKDTEKKLREVNEQIHYTGQYLSYKSLHTQFIKVRNKKKFRQEHTPELELYDAAVKFLKEKYQNGKIPSMKALKAEKEKLEIQRSAQKETYSYFKDYQNELRTVCSNVDAIFETELAKDTVRAIYPNLS